MVSHLHSIANTMLDQLACNSPAELESSKRQLAKYQEELQDKIEHQFTGKGCWYNFVGLGQYGTESVGLIGSKDELLVMISDHQRKLEREESGRGQVGVVSSSHNLFARCSGWVYFCCFLV